jgi:hypothetical protein
MFKSLNMLEAFTTKSGTKAYIEFADGTIVFAKLAWNIISVQRFDALALIKH